MAREKSGWAEHLHEHKNQNWNPQNPVKMRQMCSSPNAETETEHPWDKLPEIARTGELVLINDVERNHGRYPTSPVIFQHTGTSIYTHPVFTTSLLL